MHIQFWRKFNWKNIKNMWGFKNIFGKRDDKDSNSKKKWWNDPKNRKWFKLSIFILVLVLIIVAITYFTHTEGEQYQDISWNELTKYVYRPIAFY